MKKCVLVTGVLACLVAGCGQNSQTTQGGQTSTTTETTANTSTNTAENTTTAGNEVSGGDTTTQANTAGDYPESTDGLKRLMSDILTATKAGDKEKAASLVKGLMLTDHSAWFKETFGDATGAKLSDDYAKFLGEFEPSASQLFAQMVEKGQSNIQINRFEKAGDPKATGLQNDALKAMKSPTPLYSVRFIKPGEDAGMHLWSFVFVDGGFRFIGKMNGVSS